MPSAVPSPGHASSTHWRTPGPGLLALVAVVTAFAVFGHEGWRVVQMAILALPLLAWSAWPLSSAWALRVRRITVWIWALAFVADGAVRAYLLSAYTASPDSAFILSAIANTGSREGLEYLASQWRSLGLWLVAVVVAGIAMWQWSKNAATPQGSRLHRWEISLLVAVCLVSSVAYVSKPWRRLHPIAYWSNWAVAVEDLRKSWRDDQEERDRAHQSAVAMAPVTTIAEPSTIVLVISDSVNRDNLSLYGYGRDTSPRLKALRDAERDKMLVMRHAWSVDASTLPALRNMLFFGKPEAPNALHLLAMAKAAGYKTWWMSNHDDIAVDQQHARLADEVDLVNRVPGRSSASLDGELLDCLQEALLGPERRKFIVVHLQGAHPHYGQRFPREFNSFDEATDPVEAALVQQGRSVWLREFRQAYDAALLYHDFVVAEMLSSTISSQKTGEYRAFAYVSDHGQEVGHVSDRAGHSPNTESGYRIPTLLWRSQAFDNAAQLQSQPLRADWIGWTVADLLGLQWQTQEPHRNVLDPRYEWLAPTLPFPVDSFLR